MAHNQAHVIYSNGIHTTIGTIFSDIKFWLSHAVPTRAYLCEQIKSNGGEVVELEQNADVKIVDHLRKDLAPGTYSYSYITESLRKGRLEALQDHIAGPAPHTTTADLRNVGSARPARGTRVPFTAEDDAFLLGWVRDHERQGGKVFGNEIYKQLELVNPRHTYQSWRDRWIKYLSDRPEPKYTPPAQAQAQPQPSKTATAQRSSPPRERPRDSKSSRAPFTMKDYDFLELHVEDIMDVDEKQLNEMWEAVAQEHPHHTKDEWRGYYHNAFLPAYQRLASNRAAVLSSKSNQGLSSWVEIRRKVQEAPSRRPTATPSESPRRTSKPSNARSNEPASPPPPYSTIAVVGEAKEKKRRRSSDGEEPENPKRQRIREIDLKTPERETSNDGVGISGRKSKTTPLSPTLTAPEEDDSDDDNNLSTQAMLRLCKESQALDLTVPELPDGISFDDYDDDKMLFMDIMNIPRETQISLSYDTNNQQLTQLPNMSIPEPEVGWGNLLPPTDSGSPTTTHIKEEQSSEDDDDDEEEQRERANENKPVSVAEEDTEAQKLDQWIEHLVQTRGYSEDAIIRALKRTSMDTSLTLLILEYCTTAGRTSNDEMDVDVLPGIWTQAEDEALLQRLSSILLSPHHRQGQERNSDDDDDDERLMRVIARLEKKHGQEKVKARIQFLREWHGI